MAKSKLLKSVSAALAFGTLIHGAIAQNTTPANTAGKPNAEIQAQKSETTSYSFKALENGVELSAPGKPKLFIKSSQYPSLFRITSGNLKPFLELRPGVTIGGKDRFSTRDGGRRASRSATRTRTSSFKTLKKQELG